MIISSIKGRNGQISGFILIAEPLGFANILDKGLRKIKKLKMTPKFLAQAMGKIELSFTVEGACLKYHEFSLVHGKSIS